MLHFFQGLIWCIYYWGASKLIQIFLLDCPTVRIMAIIKILTNCMWQHMMEANITTRMAFAALVLIITYLLIQYRKIQKLPPGPWGKPTIGIVGRIKKKFHLFLFCHVKLYQFFSHLPKKLMKRQKAFFYKWRGWRRLH